MKMQPLGTFRTNAPVTEQQYKYIDGVVKYSAQQGMIARRLAPVFGPLGFGSQSVTFDKVTEMADAQVQIGWKPDKGEDITNLARTTNPMGVVSKAFRVNAQSLASSRTYGTPLDIINARSAAYKVSKKEDDILLNGWAKDGSTYDISGLYQSAGNTEAYSDDFGTAGNAIKKVKLAAAVLQADNIFAPYNMVLNQVQYNEMIDVLSSTATLEIDVVRRMLGGGDIYLTPAQTAATGMLISTGERGYFDYAIGVDVTTKLEELGLHEGNDLFGLVYETITPRIWETNGICTLTAI